MDNEAIHHLLGKIEGKLDSLTLLMGEHVKDDTAKFKDLDTELDRLANRQSWMIGIGTGVAAVFGSVVAFFKV